MPYKNPDDARTYQRERKRIERAAGSTTHVQPVPLPFRLKTAADVVALIEEQVGAVRAEPLATTLEKARTIGYLAGVALRAIETGDLAARLEIIEAEMKQRRKSA